MSIKGKKIDLLIFDLDGTLVDTRRDLTNSVNHVREKFAMVPMALQEVMQNVGDGVHNLLKRSLPQIEKQQVDEAVGLFREHYSAHLLDFSNFYPNVRAVLNGFGNKKLAVVSNKPEKMSRRLLTGLDAAHFFETILGGDSLPVMKPSPAPILHILEELGIRPDQTMMIGDSPSDVQAGHAAQCLTCAVTYGYRDKAILAKAEPHFIIDDLQELHTIIC